MVKYQCPNCGRIVLIENDQNIVKCPFCGKEFSPVYANGYQKGYQQGYNTAKNYGFERGVFDKGPSGRSCGVAALLAIFLGVFGAHYFYMGKNTAGIVFLLISVCTCFILGTVISIIALIQGIIFFTLTEEQFERNFIYTNKSIPLF